jgi:hypothetical protein
LFLILQYLLLKPNQPLVAVTEGVVETIPIDLFSRLLISISSIVLDIVLNIMSKIHVFLSAKYI